MQFSRLFLLPVLSLTVLIVGLFILPYQLFWLQILPIVGFVFLAVGSWLLVYLYHKRVPAVARLIEYAARIKAPLALITFDTGRTILTIILEFLGEGIVRTLDGTYKLLPQFAPIPTTQQKPSDEKKNPGTDENPGSNPGTEKDVVETLLLEKEYRDFINKRSILIGVDLPLFVGYSGKMTLLNPEALALYEAGEMQVRSPENKLVRLKPAAEAKTSNSKNIVKIGDKDYVPAELSEDQAADLIDLPQPLMLLDLRKISNMIGSQFNPTQFGAIIRYSEKIGEYGKEGRFGKLAGPLGFFILLLVVGGVLLLMGPQIMQMFGG